MMKRTTVDCDCCMKKDVGDAIMVRMPIIVHGEDKPYLNSARMDLCNECANRIANKYYEIAQEHGSTGIHAVMSEDWGVSMKEVDLLYVVWGAICYIVGIWVGRFNWR